MHGRVSGLWARRQLGGSRVTFSDQSWINRDDRRPDRNMDAAYQKHASPRGGTW